MSIVEKISKLEALVLSGIQSDLYNTSVWQQLIPLFEKLSVGDRRPKFEGCLRVFPRSPSVWTSYIQTEIQNLAICEEMDRLANIQYLDDLFVKAKALCPYVEIHLLHIRYLSNHKQADQARLKQMYSTSLFEDVGTDPAAGPMWIEYIDLLLREPVSTSEYEKVERMQKIRGVFRRAIEIPLDGGEQIWKRFEEYEKDIDETTFTRRLSEELPKHKGAKQMYLDRRADRQVIQWSLLARPSVGDPTEERQLAIWMKLVAEEKRNQQRLGKRDVFTRVKLLYRQMLMYFTHSPQAWCDYASFLSDQGRFEEANRVYIEARQEALPECLLLVLAQAEFEERARKDPGAAREVLDMEIERRVAKSEQMAGESASLAHEAIVQALKREISLLFVTLQKLLRRVQSTEAAREILVRAVQCPHTTWHVYAASALMELHTNKEPEVAKRIFKFAAKKYALDASFLLEYVDFLERIEDDNNIRVMLDRSLPQLPQEQSAELWNRYVDVERRFGDPSSLENVLRRRADALGLDVRSSLHSMVLKNSFRDLIPWKVHELQEVSSADDSSTTRRAVIKRHKVDALQGLALDDWRTVDPSLYGVFSITDENKLEEQAPMRSYPRPDLSIMVQFTGTSDILQDFIRRLPTAYSGPVIPADAVIQSLTRNPLPPLRTAGMTDVFAPGMKRARDDEDDGGADHGPRQVDDMYRLHQERKSKIRRN
eukprot:ANDGO_06466.mRNA.1 Cleavage stimulation factor subunit 77